MIYTDEQLITKAVTAEGFISIPQDYWVLCIRKNLDDQKPNEFNDIAYLMHGGKAVFWTTCTTVPGLPALKGGYKKYNNKGAAVLKANIWMNDCFNGGLHSGRMKALRQVKPVYTYRDGDGDSKAEQLGKPILGMWYTNFHASTYKWADTIIRKWIGHWSYGCMVCNNRQDYNKIIESTYNQSSVSILILDEFSV